MFKQHTVTRQENTWKSFNYDLITRLILNARSFGASTAEPSGAYSATGHLGLDF